jgi:hypothetical protein
MVQDDQSARSGFTYDRRERIVVIGGVHWRVRVVVSFDRRGPDLVFESDSVIRRVRSFPENWHELTDEELLRLSWSR